MTALKKLASAAVLFFLAFATLILSVLIYVRYLYPDADFLQIMTTIQNLTPKAVAANTDTADYIFALLFFIIAYPLCYMFLNARARLITALLIALITLYWSGFIYYAAYHSKTSTLYEEEYVNPENITFEFPIKKRNLILIYLESFEQNFAKAEHYEKNLIPNLSALQKEGQYAAAYTSITGTTYSIASIIASHCGLVNVEEPARDIYQAKFFLPQAVCFPEILKQNGYQTALIKAADITFTQADVFAATHGYQSAEGVAEILKGIPQNERAPLLGTFDGINDKALFEYAKQKLRTFNPNAPFMLTLFTLDTHTPRYYKDKRCPAFFNDLRDVYLCTDQTVADFISWLKASPYYENTTVAILGDHLLPARLKTKGRPRRAIYNTFLNLPNDKLKINRKKIFSSLDFAPTLLESIGVTLSPRAFGLGRSLFNQEKTLAETETAKKLNLRLIQKSKLLETMNTPKKQRTDVYVPYIPGTTLDKTALLSYTDVYDEILGAYYLDRLSFMLPEAADYTVTITFSAITLDNGKIIFSANNEKVATFTPQKNGRAPYIVTFNIKKELVKNKTLALSFRNQSGVLTAAQMGIAPVSLAISKASPPL